MDASVQLPALGWAVLNQWQRDLPLVSRPFQAMALHHGCSEQDVLDHLQLALQTGTLARIGGIIAPNTVGCSTLAAVSVPAEQVASAAAYINQFEGVNHNYLREHHYNIWFVLTAPNRVQLNAVLAQIGSHLNTRVLDLPLQAEYHVDLGFSLHDGKKAVHRPAPQLPQDLSASQRQLLAILARGLPLEATPFASVAAELGWTEDQVIEQFATWQASGLLRRMGLIVRHRRLGFHANAMCVWQVPLAMRDAIGEQMAQHAHVHLCYARPAQGEDWPYNLFAMVHGQQREQVLAHIQSMNQVLDLQAMPHAVLFSTQCFKQSGASYQEIKHAH